MTAQFGTWSLMTLAAEAPKRRGGLDSPCLLSIDPVLLHASRLIIEMIFHCPGLGRWRSSWRLTKVSH